MHGVGEGFGVFGDKRATGGGSGLRFAQNAPARGAVGRVSPLARLRFNVASSLCAAQTRYRRPTA